MENHQEKITKIVDHLSSLINSNGRVCSVYISKEKDINHLLSFKESKELIKKVDPDLLVSNSEFVQYLFERAKIESSNENKYMYELNEFENFIDRFEKDIIERVGNFKKKLIQELKDIINCHLSSNRFL
jgi:hypothetical protein